MWKCPKCKREFGKKNQAHSCNPYPPEKHFEGKDPKLKLLYNEWHSRVKKKCGPFQIDSVSCCIRFVTKSSFSATKIMKNNLRIMFQLPKKITSPRIQKSAQISPNRYNYAVDISEKKEMDAELLNWIKQAYDLKK